MLLFFLLITIDENYFLLEDSQQQTIEIMSQKYVKLEQGTQSNNDNDNDDNNNQNNHHSTQIQQRFTNEKNEIINPLYLSVSDEEKNEEKKKASHSSSWLHGRFTFISFHLNPIFTRSQAPS